MTNFSQTIARCTCRRISVLNLNSNLVYQISSTSTTTTYTKGVHTSARVNSKDYYAILGVRKNATSKDIKSAYYDKAKLYHPDASSSDNPAKSKKFQEVSEAYEILSDDSKRKAYDSLTRPSPFSSRQQAPYDDRTRPEPPRQRNRPITPVNMYHVYQVYKTLNREEPPEMAHFRPFEDHNFPGSRYNRFEYSREWDKNKMLWVYTKRRTAGEYNKEMARKSKTLLLCIALFMSGSMAWKMCAGTVYEYYKEYRFRDPTSKREIRDELDTMIKLGPRNN